ncbi:metal transporter, partial [Streptomyces anulatus]
MRVPDRLRAVADAGLGVVLAAAVAFQAYRIAGSWGDGYWLFGAAVGASVCALALIRRRDPFRTAVAGLTVAAFAVLATRLVHLPAEPGPAALLGLAVLVGSAVRTLPVRAA